MGAVCKGLGGAGPRARAPKDPEDAAKQDANDVCVSVTILRRKVPRSWSILRFSFQTLRAEISLNIAHRALNQPPQ